MTTVQNEQESERVGYLRMTQSGTHRMAELSAPVLTRSPLEEKQKTSR